MQGTNHTTGYMVLNLSREGGWAADSINYTRRQRHALQPIRVSSWHTLEGAAAKADASLFLDAASPPQETWAAQIREAGFKAVTYENMTGGVVAIHSGFKL